jgi:hypothetical protein
MPTYEYACPNGHTETAFESMSSPSTRPCAECNADIQSDGAKHEPVLMTRKIGAGAGVIWRGGSPTPRFSGRRR